MLSVKKSFEIDFFFANILVPVIALALYCSSFGYISSRFLLEGVNYYFVSKMAKYLLFVIGGALLTFFVILKAKSGRGPAFKRSTEKFHPDDFLLLLLPLTPAVQYILSNQEILSARDSMYVLIVVVLFLGLYIFALPILLGNVMPTRTLMILGLAFVFTIISMSSISDYFHWFEKGALRKQLMVFSGVFLVVWLFYNLNQRKILYLFIGLNFIVNSSLQFLQGDVADATSARMEENKLLSLVGKRTPAITPNIYLLLYDAYVPNETMLAYGIDNSAQESYLEEQGFTLYPRTYSIGATTLATMSRVLNASTEYYGNHRRAVSGDGVAQKLLRNAGYETYGVFPYDFMFQGIGSSYDNSIPQNGSPSSVLLLKGIFMGEFRFDIEDDEYNEQTHEQFVESKRRIFEAISGKQVFVYMHSNLPTHTQNSGSCLPDETDQFKERLRRANLEMKQDVNMIVGNDPSAIVVVAGDHGPHLTKNCFDTTDVYDISEISRLDIQDRYGAFLAIRWPTGDFVRYDDITVLQDLFPAVFAYLYKDATILDSKIEPIIPVQPYSSISGATVDHGIIRGGIDDGEPLYVSGQ